MLLNVCLDFAKLFQVSFNAEIAEFGRFQHRNNLGSIIVFDQMANSLFLVQLDALLCCYGFLEELFKLELQRYPESVRQIRELAQYAIKVHLDLPKQTVFIRLSVDNFVQCIRNLVEQKILMQKMVGPLIHNAQLTQLVVYLIFALAAYPDQLFVVSGAEAHYFHLSLLFLFS